MREDHRVVDNDYIPSVEVDVAQRPIINNGADLAQGIQMRSDRAHVLVAAIREDQDVMHGKPSAASHRSRQFTCRGARHHD